MVTWVAAVLVLVVVASFAIYQQRPQWLAQSHILRVTGPTGPPWRPRRRPPATAHQRADRADHLVHHPERHYTVGAKRFTVAVDTSGPCWVQVTSAGSSTTLVSGVAGGEAPDLYVDQRPDRPAGLVGRTGRPGGEREAGSSWPNPRSFPTPTCSRPAPTPKRNGPAYCSPSPEEEPGWPARSASSSASAAAVFRSSARIHCTKIGIRARKVKSSAPTQQDARTGVGAGHGVHRRRPPGATQQRQRQERLDGHPDEQTGHLQPVAQLPVRIGSSPTMGHQNSVAAKRKPRLTRSMTHMWSMAKPRAAVRKKANMEM